MCTNVSLRSGTVNRYAIGRWGPIDRTGAAECLLGATKRGLKLGSSWPPAITSCGRRPRSLHRTRQDHRGGPHRPASCSCAGRPTPSSSRRLRRCWSSGRASWRTASDSSSRFSTGRISRACAGSAALVSTRGGGANASAARRVTGRWRSDAQRGRPAQTARRRDARHRRAAASSRTAGGGIRPCRNREPAPMRQGCCHGKIAP